jgi:hypothetical protein
MLQLYFTASNAPTFWRLHFCGGLADFTLTMRSDMIEQSVPLRINGLLNYCKRRLDGPTQGHFLGLKTRMLDY